MRDYSLLAEKVILVTGVTSGFGRGTALALAEHGASLVLAARSNEELDVVAAKCRSCGAKAVAVPTDVSIRSDVQRLADQAISTFGSVDVWINNAGVSAIGRFDQVPIEDHEQVIRTDLLGTIYGSYQAIKHFRTRGVGTLINIASVLGKIPSPYYASYAAAKFGVVGLCDALRQELKQEGIDSIHVCTVMPMAHDTGFFEHAANYTGRESAPIPPTYDPKVTVEKLVELCIEPENEIITGAQGKLFNFFHKLMPEAVEKMMAIQTQKAQIKDPAPAEPTSGNLYRPSEKVHPGR